MNILRDLSFKTKLVLAVSFIASIALSAALAIRGGQTDKLLRERMLLRTGVLADVAAQNWPASGGAAYAAWLSGAKDIQFAAFFDDKEKLTTFSGEGDRKTVRSEDEDIFHITDETYSISRKVLSADGRVRGTLVLGFPMGRLYKDLEEHSRKGFFVWLFALAAVIAGMALALAYFLKPLQSIYAGAQRLAKKELSYRIPVTNHDEFGYAAEQFNIMAGELSEFYDNLEKKIAAATQELALANSNLQSKNAELHILNERLRELDRRKTEVISIVSHDLRTPLTSIIGFSDTLLNKELRFSEEDRERYIGIIRGESYRLARLISDFLVITKIEEGVFRILKTPTDLRDLIAETGRTMNLAPKAIKLKLALPDAPVLIEADRDKLLQVLHNLAGNAIKYCPENGTITIALKDTGTAVQVSVADTGPGIPDSEKERVFEKFYRRDDAVARKEAGSGLGLAIAKSIVDLHEGKISLRDAEGGGAEFSFELPRPPSI
ncbi:MAG TPA: hypothetical protein DDW67_02355 [Elusimicrobia bacterium]|nr:hypothetical protein [Elusimicrobiota bacterium]